MLQFAVRSVAVVGLLAAASASRADVSPLSSWNLIVRTNVTSSSEVDGSALIGGTLAGNSSNYAVQGVTAPGNIGLAVGGVVSGGPKNINNAGNFRYGASPATTVNTNGGGNAAPDATIASQITSAFGQIGSIASYLSTLSPNGSIDGGGNMNAVPTLINGQLVAVYSFNISAISSLGQLNLNIGSAQSVILNVSGGSINLVAPPNLIGGFNQANSSRILWNFTNATSISVNNTFNGAMVAPNADLQVLGGGINGSVIVHSITAQNAEIRRNVYTGFIPAPSAAALLGFGSLIALRRRRD